MITNKPNTSVASDLSTSNASLNSSALSSNDSSSVSLYYSDTMPSGKSDTVRLTYNGETVSVQKAKSNDPLNRMGKWDWITMIAGANEDGPSTINDSLDNTYVIGTYFASTTFHNASGTIAFTLSQQMYKSAYVGKINKIGVWQWVATINVNSPGHTVDRMSLQTDNSNNLFVSVQTRAPTITFYNSGGSYGLQKMTQSNSNIATIIGKIDSKGKWLWSSLISNQSSSVFDSHLSIDSNQNIYINGTYNGKVNFYNYNNSLKLIINAAQNNDIFVAKINNDGNWQWVSTVTGLLNETHANILIDKIDDTCYISGYSSSISIKFNDSNQNTLFTLSNPGFFIGTLDSNGYWKWTSQIESNAIETMGFGVSMALDTKHNAYLLGSYTNALAFNNSNNVTSLVASQPADKTVFVSKIDDNGNWLWYAKISKSITGILEPRDIIVDIDFNVYILGDYNDKVYFYDSDGSDSLNLLETTISNRTFLAKIDESGYWQTIYQINGDTKSSALSIDSHSNLYVSGSYKTNMIFYNPQKESSIKKLNKPGCYVAKLNNSINGLIGFLKENALPNKYVNVIFPGSTIIDNVFTDLVPGFSYYLDKQNNLSIINSGQSQLIGIALTPTLILTGMTL